MLTREARGEPKVGDFDLTRARVDEDVVGLQVLVHDALLVNVRERPRDGAGERQEARHRHRCPEHTVEGLPAEVLQNEGRHSLVGLERERFDDGRGVEQRSKLVFAFQLLEVLRAAAPRIEHLEDDGAAIGVSDSAIDDGPPPVREILRDCVRRGGGHGEGPRPGTCSASAPRDMERLHGRRSEPSCGQTSTLSRTKYSRGPARDRPDRPQLAPRPR